ncbi:hypothetical protein B0H63DRAFT_131463 [Podospora didyma]|uniref:polynucleotide adenylyltransferase n=1 Tax=Podospora didyma TaxID=330526 RepID=A0AAE0P0K5_9PEZI|nr:hypothetical protein B0H63DRAFT_131463 [Podospora didyma]
MEANPSGGGGGRLEDRLSSLIINNLERESTRQHQSSHIPQAQAQEPAAAIGHVQHENLSALDDKSKAPRKRLNQAQRRQMSAQLSIPIEPRTQMPQSARSYNSPPGYPHQQYASGGGQYRAQRPQSATFRPPSRGNAFANGPLTAQPFPSNPRHQSSFSYHGPMSAPSGHHGWQQPPQHGGDLTLAHQNQAQVLQADAPSPRRHAGPLYNPANQYHVRPDDLKAQTEMLESLCHTIIKDAEIEPADIIEKENFRSRIEEVARNAITHHERTQNGLHDFPPASVQLRCFGSLSSGFATKAADMDLGLLSPCSPVQPDAPGSPIPRIVEKAFLDIGLGARLLTRTRVPIIKVCEKPPQRLLEDLLDERAKWERGTPEESHEDHGVDEDDHSEEPDSNTTEDVQTQDGKQQGHDHKVPAHGQSQLPEQKFRSLKQGERRSLANYYNAAKRQLQKLGGRDLSNSNLSDFKKDDFQLLNEFSLAFVDGLADHELRDRLLSYKSLNRYDLTVQPNYRTLHGVYTQVEGEKLVMLWESRHIRGKDIQEQQAQRAVKIWKDLQNKPGYGLDPLFYNKELILAAEQLKKISSIQALGLSQNQYESAATYHSRAIKILLELGGHDTPSKENWALSLVIEHYIRGILLDDIRWQVGDFAKSQQALTLRAVARKHKSLQLAHDFEKSLGKGLYPEESTASIKAYVDLLRAPMLPTSGADPHFDFVVPVAPESAAVLSSIRLLTDPAKLAPNQPRDPYRDRLEFPKSGVGVQCDINFSAHLALQNTLLLRCYSHCDPRVRPLVLFVKHWAKVRCINSPYRGTLSSYGYVLMMLHYLVNVAQPFVCPNLQSLARQPDPNLTPAQLEETVICKGRNIQFWRDEAEIQRLAGEKVINQNTDSIGHLLRGFFEYYAQNTYMSTVPGRGFDWGRDVLSLRSYGGLLSKAEKGWTGAKTVVEIKTMAAPPSATAVTVNSSQQTPPPGSGKFASDQLQPGSPAAVGGVPTTQNEGTHLTREVKEVRYRYLFAIEDPFELDHNVARTVTHNGIVAIRDEFRRAWRIIKNISKVQSEELLQDVAQADQWRERETFAQLLRELHGRGPLEGTN